MSDLLLEEKPIQGTGQVIQLDTTPKTFATLGITIDPNAKFLRLYYDPSASPVLARYSHDGTFVVTDTSGLPVVPLDIHFFNAEMFIDTTHRAVAGTVDVYVEQFDTC